MTSIVRKPAVAGRFYPGDPNVLLRDVFGYLGKTPDRVRAIGCVAPHAGYMYSGHVAGAVFARVELPRKFIILGPNHTGMGQPLATMSEGAWQTPLGDALIDSRLAAELKKEFHFLQDDVYAHMAEHALEVELPFLQAQLEEFTFVPICVGVGTYQLLAQLGDAIASVVQRQSEPILIIASSDMNHYETDSVTRKKDNKAIEQMLARNPEGLYETIQRERISMCGYGPTVAMLTAARALGAKDAELVKYATSADVSGDRETCVGYAGVMVR
jgi:MEMO1 family protein